MAEVVSSEAIENNSFGFKVNQVCFYITGRMADANDLGASSFRTPCLYAATHQRLRRRWTLGEEVEGASLGRLTIFRAFELYLGARTARRYGSGIFRTEVRYYVS